MPKSYNLKKVQGFSFVEAWRSFSKKNPAKFANNNEANRLIVDNAEKMLKLLEKQKMEYELKLAQITKDLEQAKHCNTPQFKDTAYMPVWHVYADNGKPERLKDHVQKFHIIHFVLKYKVLIPAIMIFDRLFGKVKTKNIPDYWYNKNIIIHCKAYDMAERLWFENYLGLNAAQKKMVKKYGLEGAIKRERSCRLLRSIHGWALTGIMNDTAYKEFSNFYFHSFAKLMVQEYGGKGKVDHIMYLSPHIWDVNYCNIGQALENERSKLVQVSKEDMEKKRVEMGIVGQNVGIVEVGENGAVSFKGVVGNTEEPVARTAKFETPAGTNFKRCAARSKGVKKGVKGKKC